MVRNYIRHLHEQLRLLKSLEWGRRFTRFFVRTCTYIPFDGNSNRTLTYKWLLLVCRVCLFSVRFCGFDFGAIISHHHTFITRCFLKRANEQITQNLSTFALPRTSNLPTYVYLTDFQSLEHGLESKIGLMGKSSFISKKPITSMENCDWKNVYLCDRYTQEC